ncbi:MAG TPA: amino acid permease [Solirubrobacteraceae bacterium]|nr:amino acid permease [Solirubrobacteraceae bacterium]
MNERSISYRALFAVVYTTSISSVYFALGVIAHHAAGLTPAVLLVSGIFFGLSAMTYGEGASMHQERGGASVFAQYGLNDTVSFIAAWAIVLDYTILVAVTALTVPNYLAVFWAPLGHGGLEIAVALAVIGFVAADNLLGVTPRRLRRRILVTAADLAVQAIIIIVGLALVFDPHRLSQTIHLGSAPSVSGLAFALPIAIIAFTGLEAAASLAAETTASPRELRLLIGPGSFVIVLVYVGIAVVGIGALPVHHGLTALGSRHLHAPLIGVVEAYHPRWLADVLKYTVAVVASAGLMAAAGSSMLGVSRVGFLMTRNHQIPSVVGRLHQRWGTPWVVITGAALAAAALVLPTNLELLVGIYAFGALLAFTIAHLAVIALRFREPDRPRGYRIPFSVPFRGAKVPLPAVLGVLLGGAGWLSLVIVHSGARYVGIGWLLVGLAVYYGYRRSQGTPLPLRVSMPQRSVRHEALEPELGSIMVPIFGTELDDDIVQTAARLAGPEHDDLDPEGAVIEAIWVFEVPLALPLDARLPDAQVKRAKEALARAKVVGEEYEGVVVQTAMVRARRAGQAIVAEAARRGVEAIVLAAEEPSRVRGGALLGSAGPLDNYLGEVTKYVIKKAPVRVILTAPPDPRHVPAGEVQRADGGEHQSAAKP